MYSDNILFLIFFLDTTSDSEKSTAADEKQNQTKTDDTSTTHNTTSAVSDKTVQGTNTKGIITVHTKAEITPDWPLLYLTLALISKRRYS